MRFAVDQRPSSTHSARTRTQPAFQKHQENLRRSKFKGWPKGPDGEPALKDAFGGDVKAVARGMAKRELSDSAMDAVFDSFCGSPLSIVADRCGRLRKHAGSVGFCVDPPVSTSATKRLLFW